MEYLTLRGAVVKLLSTHTKKLKDIFFVWDVTKFTLLHALTWHFCSFAFVLLSISPTQGTLPIKI